MGTLKDPPKAFGRRFGGAVIDGPWMGRNAGCDKPTMVVAVLPTTQLSLSAAADDVPVSVEHVTYHWHERMNVWTCGEQCPELALKLNHRTAAKYRRR